MIAAEVRRPTTFPPQDRCRLVRQVNLTDEIKHLLQRLADPTLQQIAVWKMEGYSYDEMAVKLDCSKRTVIRKFNLIRQIAEAGE